MENKLKKYLQHQCNYKFTAFLNGHLKRTHDEVDDIMKGFNIIDREQLQNVKEDLAIRISKQEELLYK